MRDYAAFLAGKRLAARDVGFEAATIGDHLFPFQRDIVAESMRRGRSAIFADCGLGKTIMQLEWASHLPERSLILAPLAVTTQTEEEAKRFGYDARARRDGADIGSEKIVVTNYDRLHRFDLDAFGALILDESSILKSYDGAYSRSLIEAASRKPYRLACTATPAPNDHMELGTHSEFLSAMTRAEMLAMFFVHDGGSTQSWRLKGHARGDFWRWVKSWARLVTKPSDMGYSDDGFKLPPLRVHREAVASMAVPGNLFAEAATLDLRARREVRRSSLTARCERVAEIVSTAPEEQWLIWCDLNSESELLAEVIPGAVEITGSDEPEKKVEAMIGFAHGDVRTLVTKPRIAGFGMNWQRCSRMVFAGLSDSYEQFYQATRRCWRFGQKNPVDVYVVISRAETAVAENVMRKHRDHANMIEEMTA